MSSEDAISNIWSNITGANDYTYTVAKPGEGFPQAPRPYTPPSPIPDLTPSATYGKIFSTIGTQGQAIGKLGFGIGQAGRDIAAAGAEKKAGKVAQQISREDALALTYGGIKKASAVRAASGASGTTGAGSPLLAELTNIQNAQSDARVRLYQGNLENYYANQRAKAYRNKVPADIFTALAGGASLFKTET